MWRQYRKTLIPMQLFILATCAALRFIGLVPWTTIAIVFVIMEIGALAGAWWAATLHRQHRRRRGFTPLERHMK